MHFDVLHTHGHDADQRGSQVSLAVVASVQPQPQQIQAQQGVPRGAGHAGEEELRRGRQEHGSQDRRLVLIRPKPAGDPGRQQDAERREPGSGHPAQPDHVECGANGGEDGAAGRCPGLALRIEHAE